MIINGKEATPEEAVQEIRAMSEEILRMKTFIKSLYITYSNTENWTDYYEMEYRRLFLKPQKEVEPPFNYVGEEPVEAPETVSEAGSRPAQSISDEVSTFKSLLRETQRLLYRLNIGNYADRMEADDLYIRITETLWRADK